MYEAGVTLYHLVWSLPKAETTVHLSSLPEVDIMTFNCLQGKNAATAVQLCFGGIGWVLSAYSFYFLFLTLICGNRMEDD